MPVLNTDALITNRIETIRKYHSDAGIARAELDVSGGIDSAVMLMLLSKALGPDNVTAAYSSINSSTESRDRARLVAKAAGVKLLELELGDIFEAIGQEAMRAFGEAGFDTDEIVKFMEGDASVDGSLRSTLRAPIGRYVNRMSGGGIRHGTGNECEDRWLRFYQKGGDGEVDTNPLAMLSKGEVYQLALAVGVPKEIIEALPTPDLWGVGEQHNDEAELLKLSGVPWTYSRINVDTGEYARVGTIEAMSRLLDYKHPNYPLVSEALEGTLKIEDGTYPGERGKDIGYAEIIRNQLAAFGLTVEHFYSARKWERVTRHKMNPNCPSLGDRKALIEAGILTNDLPKV
jgi:NAD+ synthetase